MLTIGGMRVEGQRVREAGRADASPAATRSDRTVASSAAAVRTTSQRHRFDSSRPSGKMSGTPMRTTTIGTMNPAWLTIADHDRRAPRGTPGVCDPTTASRPAANTEREHAARSRAGSGRPGCRGRGSSAARRPGCAAVTKPAHTLYHTMSALGSTTAAAKYNVIATAATATASGAARRRARGSGAGGVTVDVDSRADCP